MNLPKNRALDAVAGGGNNGRDGGEEVQVVNGTASIPASSSSSTTAAVVDCVLFKQKAASKKAMADLPPNNNNREAGTADESNPSQEHPVPPPFNPMPATHTNPSHVHSVVPDLMRVYESLTKTNQAEQVTHQQPPQPHPGVAPQHQDAAFFQQQPPDQVHTQPQAQHVNYAYITSEEQYRQLYQQSAGSQDPNQVQHQYQGQMPSSLPYIPVPYDAVNRTPPGTQPNTQGVTAGPEKASSEESGSRPSSRPPSRRKRNSTTQQQEEATATTAAKPKGRKKAKETDARWSKRFTWPEELHRDFVSAVFDVGLKHSSPSTILEHMPKHPQITSERIKSHLQKYRVHRAKSKQEFMSSYESTLKKFKAGEMDKVKSLTDGEVGAHLTHTVLMGSSDPNTTTGTASSREAKNTAAQQPPQAGAPPTAATATTLQQKAAAPPPGHEALMLPKLTEAEKTSPIGASMGYLLGLFFSLKKQLLMQRAMNQTGTTPGSPPPSSNALPPLPAGPKVSESSNTANGPVAAVYDSFVGPLPPNANPTVQAMQFSNPMAPPLAMTATSVDWSSSNAPAPPAATGGDQVAPGASSVQNPAVNSGSTRNNLEASSMMKREMQNQMAFQNKMRALKQQELNKYKNVSPHQNIGATSNAQQQSEPSTTAVRFRQPDGSSCVESNSSQHPSSAQGDPATTPAEAAHAVAVHQGGDDESHDNIKVSPPSGYGDANAQGAGETAAAARARAPSFSMGENDDFWNADVMDEQLFEFLMNN